MAETVVYVDSSAAVKRYLEEEGTGAIDGLYHRAEAREVRLAFSLWNVGEILGAIDKARRRGWISRRKAGVAAWAFLHETLKIRRLGALHIVPVRGDLLAEAVRLLFRHGLGQADGLQITTARDAGAGAFFAADESLLRVAADEGLLALDPVADEEKVRALDGG